MGKRSACPTIWRVISELNRAERDVEQQSAALKKPLALRDLVLTQILFVVGSSWVGTAAKLGQAHLFFWLLAIVLFYIPQAAVVIYLSRVMPLEGGIYQWAKLAFNEFAGFMVAWNLWLLSIMVIALGGMFVTTNISYAIGDSAAWMPHSKWCVSLVSCAMVAGLGWIAVRGLSLGKWVHNIGGFAMLAVYAGAHRAAVHRADAWRFEGISSARSRRADDVDLLLRQHFHQTRSRRSQRIRVRRDSRRRNAITGARYRSLRHNRVTGDRARVHSRH